MTTTIKLTRRAGDHAAHQVVPDLLSGRKLKALWALWGLWLLAALLPVQAQEVYYIHTDALGSPVAETDVNRNVVKRYEYEPYGRRLNGSNDDKPGYTGHVMDAATGLVQMQQRYYDPMCGCFLSVDPVTALQSPVTAFHRYRYANNNPYKFTDPDGRFGLIGAGIGAGIELGMQMVVDGRSLSEVSWTDVGVAGAVGAVTGGVAGRLATSAAKGVISTGTAVKRTAAVGGAASAAGSATQSALNGEAPDVAEVAVSGVVGAVSAGVGARIGNAAVANLERMAGSSAPGAPNIASTTSSALVGRAAESTTTAAQQAGQIGVNAGAAKVDRVIDDKLR